jgi:A/G-specific adenine glycosylase
MKHQDIVPRLLVWFAQNARPLPWRRTRDPYAIWVSEIMLQQTRVKTVLPYWERWMRALPNLTALAKAKPHTLHKLWEGLGYYTRVRNLQRAAQLIVAQHGGRFPRDFEDVLALPGVGRYTAGAICSIAFNQPRPILDGNVIRVLTRCYGIRGNPRERRVNAQLWRLAEELVQGAAKLSVRTITSPDASRITHHASRPCAQLNESLMELGALVCAPRQPRCAVCPIAKFCAAYQQGRIHELPSLSPRIRAMPRRFVAFIAQKRGRFLVRQRPAGSVNAHLWEFPNVELTPVDSDLQHAVRKALGVRPERLELFATIKHSITRYRINLEAYRVPSRQAARIPSAKGHWLGWSRLNQRAFTSAHKQILQRLGSERPFTPPAGWP